MEYVLETRALCKYYGKGESLTKALDHVNIQIKPLEFMAICGKSGSGKSTLLNLLGGLDTPSEGDIWVDGENITHYSERQLAHYRRSKVGFIFQSFNLIPTLNVWENILVSLGLEKRKADKNYLYEILHTLGIYEKRKYLPNQLSGGQQQRVAIARALTNKPSIILADEPTGNLDSATSAQVMDLLLTSAARYGQTLILITHDEDVAQMAERMITIEDGRVVGPSAVIRPAL